MQMAIVHKHTIKFESYSVGMLAKKVYRMDATSTLFQQNKESNAIKVHFEQSLLELTCVDPTERHIVTHVVHMLKGKPYYMETRNMYFQDTIV